MSDDHVYDGNHIIGIIDLSDKGIGVRQLVDDSYTGFAGSMDRL